MSLKGFESLRGRVNLLRYHITESPGPADVGTFPAVKPSHRTETLENVSL